MDHTSRPPTPDGPADEATSTDNPFAEQHRMRIAQRNARLTAQEADPAAAAARWQAENAEAITAHNEWVRENSLPLAKYRLF